MKNQIKETLEDCQKIIDDIKSTLDNGIIENNDDVRYLEPNLEILKTIKEELANLSTLIN